jgi:uncharacterized damage-inducible protein DinB
MEEAARLAAYMDELRGQIVAAVEKLDDTKFNARIPGLINTPAILFKHLAGSERQWMHKVVAGEAWQRNRASEFTHEPVSKHAAIAALEAVGRKTRSILDDLTDAQLDDVVVAERTSGTVEATKRYAIYHALAHLAYHHGQLRMQARLLASSGS